MFGFIGWIIVGGIAGWLASIVMGTNERQGCLMNIVLGIVGGVVGGFLLNLVGLRGNPGFLGSLVTAFLGAVVILGVARALR